MRQQARRLFLRLRQRLWPTPQDQGTLLLTQKRIYILPTRAGLAYAIMLVLMLLASINYTLSLGYAITFLLGGVGVVCILHTHRNLAGLQLTLGKTHPGFAGESVGFDIHLAASTPRPDLLFQLKNGIPERTGTDTASQVTLLLPVHQRGLCPLPRMTISTTWPLGLLRAWSYAYFSAEVPVYPAPTETAPVPPGGGTAQGQPIPGTDDFHGLRAHQANDLRQQIAWKASARLDDGLVSKQFEGQQGSTLMLDLANIHGADLEQQLSTLCRQVLDAEAAHRRYGLQLGSLTISPDTGPEHRARCLEALARHA